MSRTTKFGLIALGAVAALLIVSQLVMGQLIVSNRANLTLIKSHQHTGYLTVVMVILYVGFSLATIVSLPSRSKS